MYQERSLPAHYSELVRKCANRAAVVSETLSSRVGQVAGEEERERWAARQRKSQEATRQEAEGRNAVVAVALTNNGKRDESSTPAVGTSKAESERGKQAVTISKEAPPSRSRAVSPASRDAGKGGIQRTSSNNGSGKHDRQSFSRSNHSLPRSSGSGGVSMRRDDVPATRCDGCNEQGHELKECPHRSDSAAASSEEDEDDEDDEGDEGDDEWGPG